MNNDNLFDSRTCVLVSGPPASGKTSFAQYLSDELKLPMMSKDKIKEILFDSVGFDSREQKVALGVGSMDILYLFAEVEMKASKTFILENNFENSSFEGISLLLKKYQYKAVNVRFICDDDILYDRFYSRNFSADRHPGHVYNTSYHSGDSLPQDIGIPDKESFISSMRSRGMFDFDVGGKLIEADSTDFSKLSYPELKAQLIIALTDQSL
jgi:predicted kinase